jgi:hypothetical protein
MAELQESTIPSEVYGDAGDGLGSLKRLDTAKDEETATTFGDLSINSSSQETSALGIMSYKNEYRNRSAHEELDRILDGYYHETSPRQTINPCTTTIHDRLYKEGQHSAMKRALVHQQKLEAEKYVEPPKLQMATRSYTPIRQRDSNEKAHERLYNMRVDKKKQSIVEEAKEVAYYVKHTPKPKPIDQKTITRLYEKSKSYREEGKQRREKIEKKINRRRDVTPSRSISVSRGQMIYERGLAFNANREQKIERIKNAPRESSFPKMRTQTPNRRECFYDNRDDQSRKSSVSSSGSQFRTRSSSRGRSSSVTRSRSQTPSRARSQTPNRRLSAQSNHSRTTPVNANVPKLPRSFKTNQAKD